MTLDIPLYWTPRVSALAGCYRNGIRAIGDRELGGFLTEHLDYGLRLKTINLWKLLCIALISKLRPLFGFKVWNLRTDIGCKLN